MNEELRPTLMPIKDYELGYIEGGKVERRNLIEILERDIATFEQGDRLATFEATGIYLGLKRALLIIKEAKWN